MAARAQGLDREQYPEAPSEEAWAELSEAQRAAGVASLPAAMSVAELLPPEGDPHADAKEGVKTTLREHYRRVGRSVYIATDLTVYYPATPRFSPDVLVVVDVDPRPRMKWVVSAEERGLDVVFEVLVAGDRRKDLERNVELYARVGIPEYFVFDRGRGRLHGYRLPSPEARSYVPILPQLGRYRCEMLGLDIEVEPERIRFFFGNSMLLEMPEILARLERATAEAGARAEEEARRAENEARRAEEETRRAEELSRRVAELEAELARRNR